MNDLSRIVHFPAGVVVLDRPPTLAQIVGAKRAVAGMRLAAERARMWGA